MKLIALLLALVAHSHLPPGGWRSARGFYRYAAWLQGRLLPRGLWNHGGGVALLLLPPLLPLLVLQWGLGEALFGLMGLALGVAALCFAFGGGRTLEAEVAAFTAAWHRGDETEAGLALDALAGRSLEAMPLEAMPEVAARQVVLRGRTRLIAPIFWFVLLGPVGAVGYRLVVMARAFADCQDNTGPGFCQAAGRVLRVLDWVPDRLLALGLALAGHFSAAWQAWEQALGGDAEWRLAETGLAAMNVPPADTPRDLTAEAVSDMHALLRRSLLIGLAVLAVGILLTAG